jgi:ribonuclease HI
VSAKELDNIIKMNLNCIKHPKRLLDINSIKHEIVQELNEIYDCCWFRIYTDGSRSDQGSGAAYYIPTTNQKGQYKLTFDVSIMTVELIAVLNALIFAKTMKRDKIVIITDSKSALQHIARCASGFRGVPIAYSVMQIIQDFNKKGTQLRLQWVPSHFGIQGNEKVDDLARLAVSVGEEVRVKPFYSEILPKFKSKCYELWKTHFDEKSLHKGIWYKTMQSEPPRIPWFASVSLSRRCVVTLLRLRSGHILSNKFLHLMKLSNSPNCDTCGVVEDVQHLLIECVRNRSERQALMTSFNLHASNVGLFQAVLSSVRSVCDMVASLC